MAGMATTDNLTHTLNPIYIMDRDRFRRERVSISHLANHTGLMQVLPGHPLADPKRCVSTCAEKTQKRQGLTSSQRTQRNPGQQLSTMRGARVFMRAQDPSASFMELLLGDDESGFSLDHEVLSESYVPVHPTSVPMGGLGAAAGVSYDPHALVINALLP